MILEWVFWCAIHGCLRGIISQLINCSFFSYYSMLKSAWNMCSMSSLNQMDRSRTILGCSWFICILPCLCSATSLARGYQHHRWPYRTQKYSLRITEIKLFCKWCVHSGFLVFSEWSVICVTVLALTLTVLMGASLGFAFAAARGTSVLVSLSEIQTHH